MCNGKRKSFLFLVNESVKIIEIFDSWQTERLTDMNISVSLHVPQEACITQLAVIPPCRAVHVRKYLD